MCVRGAIAGRLNLTALASGWLLLAACAAQPAQGDRVLELFRIPLCQRTADRVGVVTAGEQVEQPVAQVGKATVQVEPLPTSARVQAYSRTRDQCVARIEGAGLECKEAYHKKTSEKGWTMDCFVVCYKAVD